MVKKKSDVGKNSEQKTLVVKFIIYELINAACGFDKVQCQLQVFGDNYLSVFPLLTHCLQILE